MREKQCTPYRNRWCMTTCVCSCVWVHILHVENHYVCDYAHRGRGDEMCHWSSLNIAISKHIITHCPVTVVPHLWWLWELLSLWSSREALRRALEVFMHLSSCQYSHCLTSCLWGKVSGTFSKQGLSNFWCHTAFFDLSVDQMLVCLMHMPYLVRKIV